MTQEIQNAIEVLKNGGTILYPTDTVWGIGCDATNKQAVEKIFDIKHRDDSRSLVILVSDEQMLNRFVEEVPAAAWNLIEVADRPITIVYPKARGIASNAIAADGSVAIRIVKDPFCQQLVHKFNRPIISTSANVSGQPYPKNFREVPGDILKNVDYVVPLRQSEAMNTKPSSIVKVGLKGEINIIRK